MKLLPVFPGGRSHFSLNFWASLNPGLPYFKNIFFPFIWIIDSLKNYNSIHKLFKLSNCNGKSIQKNNKRATKTCTHHHAREKKYKWATSWRNQQNDLCAQQRLRSVWSESLQCAQWVAKVSSCGQRGLWSDWADAQADLSLRWAHRSFCWFCCEMAQISYAIPCLD